MSWPRPTPTAGHGKPGASTGPQALVACICLMERLAAPARRSEPIELRPWVQRYARRRYGPATPPAAGAAWQLLLETVYNSTDLHNDHKCAHAL